MRKMTDDEIGAVLAEAKWATICTTEENGAPYAIEATPFMMGDLVCFMINPRGGTWRNLKHNNRVLLKYTLTGEALRGWIGVSCFGEGKFITDPEQMREGWRLLGLVMGCDYSQSAEKFCKRPEHSTLFAVRVTSRTGRCSAVKGEPLPLGIAM